MSFSCKLDGKFSWSVVTETSGNESIVPKVNFKDLKCLQCKKYLSVPPIFVYTNSKNNQITNICGRCKVPKDGKSIRNESFENVAKYLQFPCSISADCSEKIAWGQAEKHEAECKFRTSTCTLCRSTGKHWVYIVAFLKLHCIQYHQRECIYNKPLIITEGDIRNKTYAPVYWVQMDKISCFVHVNLTRWELTIKIEPACSRIPPSYFNISFSIKNNMIEFKNNVTRESSEWKEHQFDLNKIREILMPAEDSGELKMSLELSEDAKTEKQPKTYKDSGSALKGQLRRTLRCSNSTCHELMTSQIFVCPKGHSICEACLVLLSSCSTCYMSFGKTRNFALEEVAQKLFNN